MKPNNFRIPVVTEHKPTADELYLKALIAKHECIIKYNLANCARNYIPFSDCIKEFNEAIEHYRELAWKEER